MLLVSKEPKAKEKHFEPYSWYISKARPGFDVLEWGGTRCAIAWPIYFQRYTPRPRQRIFELGSTKSIWI